MLKKEANSVLIPVSIFSSRKTSPLEAAVRYLKENKGMRFCEISKALGRDQRTIWATYSNATKKSGQRFFRIEQSHLVSSDIFLDRRKSFLECLVSCMKNGMELSNKEISTLLNRNPKTISTVFHRSVKKQVRIPKLR